MKKPILALSLFLSIVPSNLLAQESQQVTASDYCDFLNDTAAADPQHLYNEQMSSDPQAACILRLGVPGAYHYQVIAGREDFPIGYVNEVDEAAFAAGEQSTGYRLQEDIPADLSRHSAISTEADASLKSNLRSFAVDVPSSPMLTLATAAFIFNF